MNVAEKVRKAFHRLPPGKVIVSADLHSLSNDHKRVDKAVSRLFKVEGLQKLRNGIYFKPLASRYFGPLPPRADEIVRSLRKQYRARIVPSGPLAAYELGFSGHAPEERTYDTDKRIATIYLCNDVLHFRQVSARKLSATSYQLTALLNALEFFFAGHNKPDYSQIQFVKRHLNRHSHSQIEKGLSVRPLWFRERIKSIFDNAGGRIYITGISALNVPFEGTVGDWHQIGMLANRKFHLAGENYQGAPGLTAQELFDCGEFLNKHGIKINTTECAKPARAVKDILYSNIIVKNRYPDFFRKDGYLLPLSDRELQTCVNELRPLANTAQSKLFDQWLTDNEIH